MDLAGDVVAFLAEAFEAGLSPVDIVERSERRDLGVIDRGTLLRRIVGQGCVPDDAAFDHVHHVEHRAGDAIVLAKAVGLGDGETERIERRDDAILTINRVGRGQQLARGFAAHDVFLGRRDQLVSRIGLAALELSDFKRALVALDIGFHPGGQFRLVETMALGDFLGAGEEVRRVCVGHVLPCCRRPVCRRHPVERSDLLNTLPGVRSRGFVPSSATRSAPAPASRYRACRNRPASRSCRLPGRPARRPPSASGLWP